MRSTKYYISTDPEVLVGQVIFKGTKVPLESLFDHVEKCCAIDEFLEDFPSVSRIQAVRAL